MQKTKNPWITCAACTLLLFGVVGLTASAFSVYQPYLISVIGLSNTQASTVVSVRILCSIPAIYFVQHYLRRLGLRLGVVLACLIASAAFFVFGNASGFAECCLAAAMHGIAYGLGGMVAASIIIKQVFTEHQTTALGICAAGTGIASTTAPLILTPIIENLSLRTAFWSEAVFLLVTGALVWLLLGMGPRLASHDSLPPPSRSGSFSPRERENLRYILPAIVCIGTMGVVGWAHLSVLYTTEGFPGSQVSWFISLAGISLTAGKLIVGRISDRLGGRRAVLFCACILIPGHILACLAGLRMPWTAVGSMCLLGLGLPLSTVGFSIFAGDLVEPDHYATSVRNFQLTYRIGSLVFEPVPGIIADVTGSYVPAYGLLVGFAALALLLILRAYRGQLSSPAV